MERSPADLRYDGPSIESVDHGSCAKTITQPSPVHVYIAARYGTKVSSADMSATVLMVERKIILLNSLFSRYKKPTIT